MVGIRQLGVSQPLELAVYDWFLRSQPDLPADPRILIVGITEEDIQTQQAWPLSDETIATLLSELQQHNPKAIGLDIYRDIPHRPGHQALQQQLKADNIIAIENLGDLDTESVPAPPGIPTNQVGFNDLVIDPDGIIRRQLLFAALGEQRVYSLSLQLSLLYLGKTVSDLDFTLDAMELGSTDVPRLKNTSGGYQTIDKTGYQTLVRYRSSKVPARMVSLNDVLEQRTDPDWIKDKIILIGTTALSHKDYFYTPYSSSTRHGLVMPGVVIHANMTSHILGVLTGEHTLVQFWPDSVEVIWVGLWTLAGSFLIHRLNRLKALSLASLGCVFSISGVAFWSLTQGIWIPCAVPLLGFGIAGVATLAYEEFYRRYFDKLTGLSNRNFFIQTLTKALQPAHPQLAKNLAILYINIDKFNLINENLGRATGDKVLQITSSRLRSHLPPKANLAKLDGDNFVVLLQCYSNFNDILELADRLQSEISRPIELNQHPLVSTASIGVLSSEVGQHKQPEAILRDAQIAMYRAKAMGKARYEVFSNLMRTQSAIQFSLQSDLYQAVEEEGQLRLHYQPLICLKTGAIRGFEALVRWQHPQKGMIYPNDFIPLAEESGLIVPLGYWILREACRQTQEWQQMFPQEMSLFISVNLSGCQFTDVHLAKNIERIIQETGLCPHDLKLELTESVVMEDVEASIDGLTQLKALNVKLGIDDFGTGYSSLSYLHRFPIDTLKVDRSFVMQMDKTSENYAIVKTIIALSHNLSMNVVAEGIEEADQATKLRELGCEYGQGYLFSKPVPPDAVSDLLANPLKWLSILQSSNI